MLLQAIYDSFDAIPEFARAEYEQKNGKWALKQDAIQGGGEHLNSGLAANRDALRAEKEQAQARAQQAEQRAQTAEAEVSRLKSPGTFILSADDKKSFDAYVALGDVKTVKAKIEEHGTLKARVTQIEKSEALRAVADAAKVNFDVLNDQLAMPGRENLSVAVEDVAGKDAAGKDVVAKQAFMLVNVTENGVIKQNKFPLADYVKTNWPGYVAEALAKPAQANQQSYIQQNGQPVISPTPVMTFPPVAPSNQQQQPAFDPLKIAEQFNAQRNARPNPLDPAPAAKPAQAAA